MKNRRIGLGLWVGLLTTLSVSCPGAAQAFSLGSTVSLENYLSDPASGNPIPYTGEVPIEQGPFDLVVGPGVERNRFGGLWDIDLGNYTIVFRLNSGIRNLISGDDVYEFRLIDYVGLVPESQFVISTSLIGPQRFRRQPQVILSENNQVLRVIFPQFFPSIDTPDLRDFPGQLGLEISLQPQPVPTPALLPGLVALGLGAIRKHHNSRSKP